MASDDSAFEEIVQEVATDMAFDAYVASTAQMGKMLAVVVDMASEVAHRAKIFAEQGSGVHSADDLYKQVYMHVWDATLKSMFEANRQYEIQQAVAAMIEQQGTDDDD